MKRLILFITIGAATLFGMVSCDPGKSAVNNLEDLVSDIETNYKDYTQADWEKASLSYEKIVNELDKHEFTDEDLDKIGHLKGKYMGLKTKKSLDDLEKQATEFGKQVDDVLQGFSDVFSKDGQE